MIFVRPSYNIRARRVGPELKKRTIRGTTRSLPRGPPAPLRLIDAQLHAHLTATGRAAFDGWGQPTSAIGSRIDRYCGRPEGSLIVVNCVSTPRFL